jgi:F-type H+-transporting ATPase subunit epsilon
MTLDVERLVLPGSAGVMTIYPGHTPSMTLLKHGALIAFEDEETARFFALHEGFAEVLDDRVVILADKMETSETLDHQRAADSLERAQKRVDKGEEDLDGPRASASIARALARIQTHDKELY